jgi:hypothetical protein
MNEMPGGMNTPKDKWKKECKETKKEREKEKKERSRFLFIRNQIISPAW